MHTQDSEDIDIEKKEDRDLDGLFSDEDDIDILGRDLEEDEELDEDDDDADLSSIGNVNDLDYYDDEVLIYPKLFINIYFFECNNDNSNDNNNDNNSNNIIANTFVTIYIFIKGALYGHS